MVDIPGEDDADTGGTIFTEKSPHEPEEFDPDSLGPSAPTPSESDFQSEAGALFVKLVVVFNVALFALALGPMLWYFRGQASLGGRIFLVGCILFAYGTYRYWQFTREDSDAAAESEPENGSDPGAEN